jgi:3-oxoacyl-[acyl-carrier protein] reductase
MEQPFSGRVAVVTGAAGAIGAATVRRFIERGAAVVGDDVSAEGLSKLQAQLVGEARARFVPVVADVTTREGARTLAERATAAFGRLDILVNVVGGPKDARLLDMTEHDWEWVLRLNLTSAFLCMQAALPYMVAQRFGRIINISSRAKDAVPWFWQAGVGRTNYAAAKAGLIGLTRAAAAELAEFGITVNCVSPGPIVTDRNRSLFERLEQDPNVTPPSRLIPLRRCGRPEDVAVAITFLALEESGYITGQVINVDGGL